VVTLVNKLQLARSMPLTCAETGHVLLFDKKSPKSRAYVVNRARVSAMLHGLCHGVQARAAEGGFVHGGRNLEAEEPGAPVVMDGLIPTRTFHGRLYERYDGPDHEDGSRLHGRWFLRGGTPNRYYRDVRIDADRLQSLPEEGEPEALVQVELDGGIAEHTDLGPAAAQHELESEGGGLRAAGGGGGAAQVHGGGAAGDHGGGGDAGGGSSSGATVARATQRSSPTSRTSIGRSPTSPPTFGRARFRITICPGSCGCFGSTLRSLAALRLRLSSTTTRSFVGASCWTRSTS